MTYRKSYWRILGLAAATLILTSLAATLGSFPWDTDPQGDQSASGAAKTFYGKAYSGGENSTSAAANTGVAPLSAKEQFYVRRE